MIYIGIIVVTAIIQITVNGLFVYTWFQSCAFTFTSIGAVVAVDIFFAWYTRVGVDKVNPFRDFYLVGERERRVWVFFGVRRWKEIVPDLGKLVNFPKGVIADPRDPAYLAAYLRESCAGEKGHSINAAIGFLVIFIFPLKHALHVGIWVAIVNAVLNLMAVGALRYNRFTLYRVYRRAKLAKGAPETAPLTPPDNVV